MKERRLAQDEARKQREAAAKDAAAAAKHEAHRKLMEERKAKYVSLLPELLAAGHHKSSLWNDTWQMVKVCRVLVECDRCSRPQAFSAWCTRGIQLARALKRD